MIRVVARIVVAEENVNEFLVVAKHLVEMTRKLDGPVEYNLVCSLDDPTQFRMLEVWNEMEDLEAHLATDHFQTAIPRIGELALEAPPADVFKDVI